MTAYMIAQVDVTDPEKFDAYRALVPGTLEKYGGKYIVRGGDMAVLEGDMPFPRVVVIQFPDLDSIKRWHASEEYAGPLAMRQASSDSVLIGVDGYDG
jgi:uncharacterized protein (DUF1330 family)